MAFHQERPCDGIELYGIKWTKALLLFLLTAKEKVTKKKTALRGFNTKKYF
jgi:hypothetical protein